MSDHYEFKMGMYLGELQQPFEQSLATARDLGAHYVWCGTHSDNRSLYELADAEIDQAAEQVAAHGLEFFLLDGAGYSRTVHLAELEPGKMLEHAQFKEHFTKLERVDGDLSSLGGSAQSVAAASPGRPSTPAGKPTWPMRWATRGGIISDGDMAKLVEAFLHVRRPRREIRRRYRLSDDAVELRQHQPQLPPHRRSRRLARASRRSGVRPIATIAAKSIMPPLDSKTCAPTCTASTPKICVP